MSEVWSCLNKGETSNAKFRNVVVQCFNIRFKGKVAADNVNIPYLCLKLEMNR